MERPPAMPTPEAKEKGPELIGKITILRHGDTLYSGEEKDLTDKGVEQIKASTGKIIEDGRIGESDDVLFATSPAARSKYSVEIMQEELEKNEKAKEFKSIRPIPHGTEDSARFSAHVEETIREIGGKENWENHWASHDQYKDGIERVVEARQGFEDRSYRGLEYAIRSFYKYQKEPNHVGKTPHLIAVSHFEFMFKFVSDVFEMDLKTANLIKKGEVVEIDVLGPGDKKKEDEAVLKVTFRGETKTVSFDRHERKILPAIV